MSIALSRLMLLYLFCPFGIFKLRADKWEHSFNQLRALAQSGKLCISGGYLLLPGHSENVINLLGTPDRARRTCTFTLSMRGQVAEENERQFRRFRERMARDAT